MLLHDTCSCLPVRCPQQGEMQSKSTIRKIVLEQRQAIDQEEKIRAEARIVEHIRTLPQYQEAKVVALYYPIRGEVNLLSLWHEDGKLTLFPKVEGQRLAFYPAGAPDDLASGCFGIPEPSAGAEVLVSIIDLIFVPGMCFDFSGHRLGYGKGYYDRLIQANPDVLTAGVCFDQHFVERLPVDPWDANVDCVVTQTGLFKIKR